MGTVEEPMWSIGSDESNDEYVGGNCNNSVHGEDNPDNLPMEGKEGLDRMDCAKALQDESTTPLYCGSNLSRLDNTLMFMNVCRTYKVSNACINELLHLLSKVILPTPNSMPTSEGKATTMLSRIGLQYNAIDACRNGCVLYRNEYTEMEFCPTCHAGRYKTLGLSRVPIKVLRHFPLGPRLRRMFSTPQLASLMTWHAKNLSDDNKM